MSQVRIEKVRILILILLISFLAVYFRWKAFPFVQVYSDSLSPFAGGVQFFELGFAKPPNPESDHWLWFSTLPFLSMASSLQELFWFRFLGNVVIIPLGMLSVYILLPKHRIFGAGAVGALLAVDSGLLDTLVSSFRGYFAPEHMGLACLGVALYPKKRRLGLGLAIVGSVLAGGQHPLALGSLLGLGFLGLLTWGRSRQNFWLGLGLVVLCFLPRIFWTWQLLQCDSGGLSCLSEIAMSSSERVSIFSQLIRVLHDRFWVEMGIGGVFLLLGLWHSRKEFFTQWVLFSILGVLILGLSISTLRPYHFRALAVPMVVASVLGWMRIGRISFVIVPIWFISLTVFPPRQVAWKNQIQKHDQIASVLCEVSGSFWLEGFGSEELDISLQGLAISYWLQDCDSKKISPKPVDNIVLLASKGLDIPVLFQEDDYALYQISSVVELEALDPEKRVTGYDFVVIFVPENEIILP